MPSVDADDSPGRIPLTPDEAGRVSGDSRGGPSVPRSAVAMITVLIASSAGALTTVVLGGEAGLPIETGAVAFVALFTVGAAMAREPQWASLLPLMGTLARLRGALLGAAVVAALDGLTPLPEIGVLDGIVVAAATGATALATRRVLLRLAPERRVRVAVMGSAISADSLDRELRVAHQGGFEVVGRIDVAEDGEQGEVPTIGSLGHLGATVAEHDIGLLLMTGEAPRLTVFDEVARSCLDLPVRLRELAGFYEDLFGHVPVAEINASWFQYIIHPKYRAHAGPAKRAIDVLTAGLIAIPGLPLVGLLAVLVRSDGGPAFFRQRRIGEGGQPFTILKLRTMRVNTATAWAAEHDERITRVGRLLRRTHLDELPQLVNILRGEMSIVGPRPEQPAFVEQLEAAIPFYERRHLVKPGLTGWAQVRCGYAGSELGSAWKVCHDLYYVKHRSLALDLVILGETLRTLVADPQYTAEPSNVNFILAAGPASPLDVGA